MTKMERGFDQKTGILFYKRSSGIMTLDEIQDKFGKLVTNNILPRDLRILDDATENQISFSTSDLPILIDKFEKVLEEYNSVKHAVIQTDVRNVAYTILIGNMIKSEKYSLEVFSSAEEARKWLGSID